MEMSRLGGDGPEVSRLCLGTMTFGEQNSESEAHDQISLAVERGINLIDTAEMYPVPPRKATQGRTEEYLGSWLAKRGRRDDLIVATKVSGPSSGLRYIRGGPRLDATHITAALDGSLRRLRTDYVDLYQVHWPHRDTNYFGKLGYVHRADEDAIEIEETLEALSGLVERGKVRQIGVSNETPWGAMRYIALAESRGYPRIVSIQNPYNLLNRSYEVGLAEIAHRERLGLLAYSPLAFGVLSGKYLGNIRPPGARLSLFKRFDRYSNARGTQATSRYVALARENGLTPAGLALAFVNSRPFLTSNIVGATSVEQLSENIDSAEIRLSDEVLAAIESIHERHSNPCP
ncbi:MAG: NADP(H)-dependent aldo-keto reductase [Pseudomonadota bacterium]|nr:NADP(H)-dependent aldo-keto reductase [Pseudomonadota bacterium]